MTPTEAAKLLELPVDASPGQIEARFLELRRKLEDRIAKAPTPGLQAKYREALAATTTAHEILTGAADGSELPVLQRQRTEDGGQRTARPPADSGFRSQVSALPSKPKASSKEFLIVTFIAVAALAAGGWFVLHTRAEKTAQARIEAEARAAADRAAEEKRLAVATEQQRLAEAQRRAEEDKLLATAAARAEQERQDKLLVAARVQLAEAKLAWSEFETEVRRAERDAADARSELRALRDASPEQLARAEARREGEADYAEWTASQLTAHPARRSLVRLEELVSSRQAEAAARELVTLKSALQQLQQDVTEAQRTVRSTTGAVQLTASPGTFAWELRDAFGQIHRGTTPATVEEVAVGAASVRFTRDGWPARVETVVIRRGATVPLAADHVTGRIELKTEPTGMSFTLVDALQRRFTGTTPVALPEIAAGASQITFQHDGWSLPPQTVTVTAGETLSLPFTLQTGTLVAESTPAGADVYLGARKLGVTPLNLTGVPAGRHLLQLRKTDHKPVEVTVEVQAASAATLRRELVSSLTEADHPIVYIYRPKRYVGMAAKIRIGFNDQEVISLPNGSYHAFRMPPGRYIATADGPLAKQRRFELTLNVRQTYFVRTGPAEGMSMSPVLDFADEATARQAMSALNGDATPQLLRLTPLP